MNSRLADNVRKLRGDRTRVDFAKMTGISDRTLGAIENDEYVRHQTITALGRSLNLSEDDFLELLFIPWIRVIAGKMSKKLIIESTGSPSNKVQKENQSNTKRLFSIVNSLSDHQIRELTKMLERPGTLGYIESLNRSFDEIKRLSEEAKSKE